VLSKEKLFVRGLKALRACEASCGVFYIALVWCCFHLTVLLPLDALAVF